MLKCWMGESENEEQNFKFLNICSSNIKVFPIKLLFKKR